MADGSAVGYALILLTGSLVLAALGRALVRLPRVTMPAVPAAGLAEAAEPAHRERFFPRRLAARLHEDRGTATVEFVLVFGPALMVCLILLQTVLLFSANFFIYYAAYSATRSAIVHIPHGLIGGGGQLTEGDDAYRSAENAAAFALLPVSGRGNVAAGTATGLVDGLAELYASYDTPAPNWVARLAAARLAYARQHTRLVMLDTVTGPGDSVDLVRADPAGLAFGPKDPVSLGVTHRLHLSIPFASMIFADGQHETAGGTTAYTNVYATATMTLEGYDRNLPPPPVDEQGRLLERQP